MTPATAAGLEPVLRLAAADRARCVELAVSRAWGAEERVWDLLFEVGEVYGIEDGDGRLLATAVLSRYGTQLATVSLVLVAESHEHQGYGTAIMRHVLDQAGGATVVLHSTPAGRPLYESLGFRTFGGGEPHVGRFDMTGTRPGGSREATEADLPKIAELDREVFGADRTALIKRLPRFADRIRVLQDAQGAITGYGATWRDGGTTMIGPVLAPDFVGARNLITDLADGVAGPLRLDVDAEADDLSTWVCGHGLKVVSGCTHMALGGVAPMDVTRLHAPLMCALG